MTRKEKKQIKCELKKSPYTSWKVLMRTLREGLPISAPRNRRELRKTINALA